MKTLALVIIAGFTPNGFAQNLEFKTPAGLRFVTHNLSLDTTYRTPVFRGHVDNKSGIDWSSITISIYGRLTCMDEKDHQIGFVITISDVGSAGVDIVEPALDLTGQIPALCSFDRFTALRFLHGETSDEHREKLCAQQDVENEQQLARIKAEVREQERIAAKCHEVYRATVRKKVAELTVAEDRAVKACDTLNLYK